jgi:prophage maintenance system killer protein
VGAAAQFMQACFAAGTPIRTPEGAVAIEQIKVGDVVLSRSEFDPAGPVEAKVVEEVFVRTAPVLDLRVGGRTITTTGEHPFFAEGRGWVAARLLEPGERVLALSGEWLPVEGVDDAGAVTTVYNFRVADHHTYFVGTEEWGFSIWAHNANYPTPESGGFAHGITPGEIAAINQEFGGTTPLLSRPENALFNASYAQHFWDKVSIIVRDIAGGHMFDNGNKRTAQAVAEELMRRNNVSPRISSDDFRRVTQLIGEGKVQDVGMIGELLKGEIDVKALMRRLR